MNDFLNNLVERSLSATGTVRPRLPSVFEPPSVNGGAFFHSTENPELPTVEQHHQEPNDKLSRLQSLRNTTPAPATQFVAALPKAELSSPESTELPKAPQQIRTRVDLPEKSVPLSRARHATADGLKDELGAAPLRPQLPSEHALRPSSDAPSRASGDEAKKDEIRAAPLRPQLRSEHAPSPSSDAPSRARQTSGDGARKADVGAAAPVRPRLPSERKPSLRSENKPVSRDPTKDRPQELHAEKVIGMIAPERDPRRELIEVRDVRVASQRPPSPRLLAAEQQPKKTTAPPAINVTIGRVEIRAVPPPPQQRAKPKPATVLSLEEYLRQRAEGGRR